MGRDRRHAKQVPAKAKRDTGFRHAGAPMRDTLKTIAGRHGFAEADVLLRWAEIVGPVLSAACRPVKVTYGAQRDLGATLIVQTDSGRAPEVEHQAPLFVDRVNRFYGYRAIRRLRVTQSTGLAHRSDLGFAEDQTPFAQHQAVAPSAADRKSAENMAADIASPALRAALARMGAQILANCRGDRR